MKDLKTNHIDGTEFDKKASSDSSSNESSSDKGS
jgi:hypothetical protein